MKFMAKTEMQTATFRDLHLASMQGTLVDFPLEEHAGGSARQSYYRRVAAGTFFTYVSFLFSLVVLVYGIVVFRKLRQSTVSPNWNANEPLVFA